MSAIEVAAKPACAKARVAAWTIASRRWARGRRRWRMGLRLAVDTRRAYQVGISPGVQARLYLSARIGGRREVRSLLRAPDPAALARGLGASDLRAGARAGRAVR